jgi:N-methylhydantoinase A
MLSSNIVLSKSRTYIATSDSYSLDVINDHFASLRNEVDADFPASHRTSQALTGEVAHHYAMDMHYKGETHEITVPLASGNSGISDEDIRQAVEAFHAAHEQLHTFANRAEKTHFMNLKLETVIHTNKPPLTPLDFHGTDSAHAVKARRPVYFPEVSGPTDTPIYEGARLRCGNIMGGPCIIEEPGTTIVVYPGMQARLTSMDNYEISIG